MLKRRPTSIFGLEQFGMTPAALRRLGKRPVTVEVEIDIPPQVYPSRSELRRLLRIPPPKRRALVHQWRRQKYAALRKELSVGNVAVMKFNTDPIGVRFRLQANSVDHLRGLRNASVIRIRSIEGVRAKKSSPAGPRLYAVKGRMVFQSEGQTRGTQLCEERITVVTARSEREARARVAHIMAGEVSPFLSTSGHLLRWNFEGVTDVCECPDEEFASKGTEVFYRYLKRRVRPEHEWHPAPIKRMQPARAGQRRNGR